MHDLEKQLVETQDELTNLRSKLNAPRSSDDTIGFLHSLERPFKRAKPSFAYDFTRVRCNLIHHGHGFVTGSLPQPLAHLNNSALYPSQDLPARSVGDHLTTQFEVHFLGPLPVLHWPGFMESYDQAYQDGSLESFPQSWIAVFYAVLACGTLCDTQKKEYNFESFSQTLWLLGTENMTNDHAIAGLLWSIYLMEVNKTTAAWTTLGYAVRVGQSLGLHRDSNTSIDQDDDLSRRLWWSIYIADRFDFIDP